MRISFCKIFFLIFLITFAKSDEPHCSKYDFEEKVLEKMVRMEFQMERMKSEMEQTAKSVDTKIKELQNLKDQSVTPTVAFKARVNANTAAPKGQVIVFPVVLFNEGDAYSSKTGKFMATTNGTYLFTIGLCMKHEKLLHVAILIDGVAYTKTNIYGDLYDDCVTADAIAVLKSGQSVWVQPSGSVSGNIIQHDSSYWSTFSGTLLHK
ncbi:heavy metal-binding protein HIP-like [Ruditapes philippinarum]|uniref:heavy metal-binding protein HIP-like n=1 Tax=Ruditapes philippinarum TaxID=129788 RepID=UPI00295B65D4|nr:heavy metal-binding protein HIP-like [Ruditapes philippinarum]